VNDLSGIAVVAAWMFNADLRVSSEIQSLSRGFPHEHPVRNRMFIHALLTNAPTRQWSLSRTTPA
jgi:hypothetical protein